MKTKYREFLFVSILVSASLVGMIGVISQPARAGAWIVLSDGFETGVGAWFISDETPASGLDYWGISGARVHSGASSVWCAQVGTSSVNGQPNSLNGYYDQDMDANLLVTIGDVSGYSSVTVSFWYWAVTGSFSLADDLSFWYFDSFWLQGWSQTSVSSGGWQQVTQPIPNTSTSIGFVFRSDPTVGLGPYEGVYLDDVTVTGIDSVPPQSSVNPLSAYLGVQSFPVDFASSDNAGGSGFQSVTLYYRLNGGSWTAYGGTYSVGPIAFTTTSDGTYDFYTIATDRSGNIETAPSAPDASTMVDTQAPSLAISQPAPSQWIGSTTVGVAWSGSDLGSGIDRYAVALDGGAPVNAGTSLSFAFNGVAEGSHSIIVTACDRAGNSMQVSVGFGVDVTDPSLMITSPAAGRDVVEGDVVVSWTGSDSGAGIDHYEVRLDNGPPVRIDSGTTHTFTGVPDGAHSVTVKAVDVAGNTHEERVDFRVNTNWLTGGGSFGWFPMAALILGIVVVLFLVALFGRRRKKPAKEAPSSEEQRPT